MRRDELAASIVANMAKVLLVDAPAFPLGRGYYEEEDHRRGRRNFAEAAYKIVVASDTGRTFYEDFAVAPGDAEAAAKLQRWFEDNLPEEEQRRLIATAAVAENVGCGNDRKPWLLKGVVLGLAGVGLVVAAVLGFIPGGASFGFNFAWSQIFDACMRVLLMAVGIGLVVRAIGIIVRSRLMRSHRERTIGRVPPQAVARLRQVAGRRKTVNPDQARVFVSAILWSSDIRQRVVETYVPDSNTLTQRVHIDGQLPLSDFPAKGKSGKLPQGLETIYFPILIPRKGELHDNLVVYDADGSVLPMLSYREYLQIAASTLRLLLSGSSGDPLPAGVDKAEYAALYEIVQRRQRNGQVLQSDSEKGFQQIRKFAPLGVHFSLAADFAEKLRDHYAMVVVVQPDETGRFVVRYEQTLVPPAPRPTLRSRLAGALGARPLHIHLGLDNASTCQSFHVQVLCPDNLYLTDQELIASSEVFKSKQMDAPTTVHAKFQHRYGQAHAHFYARFFPGLAGDLTKPRVKFTFCEVPPASVFRATVAAVACFLLVWVVGVVISRRPDPGTDAPAFILAFPAVAAALLGFDKPSRGLLDSTLYARVSLIATALLSVLASALFMAIKALSKADGKESEPLGGWVDWPQILSGFSVLGVTSWLWIVLVVIAFLNAAVGTCYYAARYAKFAYMTSRNELEGDRP